jgi:hypothetical protein
MRSLMRLGWPERRLALEALALLVVGSLAIRLLPFRWVVGAAARLPARRRGAAPGAAQEIARIVDACANRLPWRAVCFQRGLAAHVMMRRRGLPAILHYGATPTGERGLNAHVWVAVGQQVVVGAAGLAGHVTLARFPADADS